MAKKFEDDNPDTIGPDVFEMNVSISVFRDIHAWASSLQWHLDNASVSTIPSHRVLSTLDHGVYVVFDDFQRYIGQKSLGS